MDPSSYDQPQPIPNAVPPYQNASIPAAPYAQPTPTGYSANIPQPGEGAINVPSAPSSQAAIQSQVQQAFQPMPTPNPPQAPAQQQPQPTMSVPTQASFSQQPIPPEVAAAQQARAVVSAEQPGPHASQTGSPTTKPAVNPNSTQNTLQIAEIRDGIVIMNDGSFRSVVMVKSINFDLMSQQEQEAVEFSYQGFLNSLYFPIQIFIRSQKVDLQPYIEKLDKIRSEHDNMLLALLMEDYIDYMAQLSQQTNIMDKKFYIVIPYFPHEEVQKALTNSKNFFSGLMNMFSSRENHVVINEADLEKAKSELRNRVQAVLTGLLQSNIQGLPLDTQELIELYYDTYNPDTATRQQLKNFNDLNADIITKGNGSAPQAHLQRELQ